MREAGLDPLYPSNVHLSVVTWPLAVPHGAKEPPSRSLPKFLAHNTELNDDTAVWNSGLNSSRWLSRSSNWNRSGQLTSAGRRLGVGERGRLSHRMWHHWSLWLYVSISVLTVHGVKRTCWAWVGGMLSWQHQLELMSWISLPSQKYPQIESLLFLPEGTFLWRAFILHSVTQARTMACPSSWVFAPTGHMDTSSSPVSFTWNQSQNPTTFLSKEGHLLWAVCLPFSGCFPV